MTNTKPTHWRFQDLTSKQFGRLRVVCYAGRRGRRYAWRCRCSCGRATVVMSCNLKQGHTQSCGCLAVDRAKAANTSHGRRRDPIYSVWRTMNQRCSNRRCRSWPDYGGRGIRVCRRWQGPQGFLAFLRDMGPRPVGYTLDRKRVNGNYSPGNCRWASRAEQSRNRRCNRWLTLDGLTMTIGDWAAATGIQRQTITLRVDAGWPTRKVLTTPAR